MQVICKEYKTCDCKRFCDHSIIHDTITEEEDEFNSCSLKSNLVKCHCSEVFLRKMKLEKLKNQ